MRRPPVIRELQALAKPKGRHVETTESQWLEFVAAITNPELLTVVAFCLIGLLLVPHFHPSFP